ncbi:hypothetical protein [Hyphomicrobium sp.]|uniref:hypothetical protein n=1 Tax=Hyphomicrobium sp. TaxID=82 RepID=UPI000FB5E299|nr:hypothetical protein [Hyphomicrobium sp.]RUP07694.1 MAG: hypothetical protein EKK38_19180 [Hyphomicrobium sp.]
MPAAEQNASLTSGCDASGTVIPHPALRRLVNIQREFEQSFAPQSLHETSSPQPERANETLARWRQMAKRTLIRVAMFSIFANVSVLIVPVSLLQLSDFVLPDRGLAPLLSLPLLTLILIAAMAMLDIRRGTMLNGLAVSMEMLLGNALLSAMLASGPTQERGYVEVLRDLHKVRIFLGSPTMLHLIDAPMLPLFLTLLILINPGLGVIVLIAALVSGSVVLKGARASSMAQALTAAAILGWGMHLVLAGTLTIGMMIAAAIIAGRALRSFECVIGGWKSATHAWRAYARVRATLVELATVAPAVPSLSPGIATAKVLPLGNTKQRSHHIAMSC